HPTPSPAPLYLLSLHDALPISGKSLMPEGLEKDLTRQDLADVIAYLRVSGPPRKELAGNKPVLIKPAADGLMRTGLLPASSFRGDRKSTRLNSSHGSISYAVFC